MKIAEFIIVTSVVLTGLIDLVSSKTCSYGCQEAYQVRERYTEKCGKFGWRRCTRYRTVTRYRPSTCYKCCDGWAGSGCNTPLCPQGCQGRGSCSQPGVCACHTGYSPPRCNDINECAQNNGGCQYRCVNTVGSFDCKCQTGFQLKSDRRTCTPVCFSSTTCPNGGKCERPNYCSCPVGFSQPKCEDINECSKNNGGCQHTCINNLGSFKCACKPGYLLQSDGKTCIDINECDSYNGGCNHICTNTPGSYECSCNSGFQLDTDERTCLDIDECLADNGNCAQICNNSIGSYSCQCRDGYTLDPDEKGCTDIDECLVENGGCSNTCVNTNGSYHCVCPSGFRLDETERVCQDIDECKELNGGCAHDCRNSIGSYSCHCRTGYRLNDVDRRSCDDIDECATENGGCNQICTNSRGSYTCSCNEGYILRDDRTTCEDIDECKVFNGGCEQICKNLPGSFLCKCQPELILSEDKQTCVEKDFCADNNGGCQHTCTRISGGRTCSCNIGYELQPDAKTCSDKNECLEENGGCSDVCINKDGSYQCQCKNGFALDDDKRTCKDVDECLTGNGGCTQQCENTVGSFKCSCRKGFHLKGTSDCEDINECLVNLGSCEEQCTNTVGSYICSCSGNKTLDSNGRTCSDGDACIGVTVCQHKCVSEHGKWHCDCNEGYQLNTADQKSCSDINECATNNGNCSELCINEPGSFRCDCNITGQQLNPDKRTCKDLCNPNPCLHKGVCTIAEDTFNCSCPTGFTGTTCHRGLVTVDMPDVVNSDTPSQMIVHAKPNKQLIVRPVGKNLIFSPIEAVIKYPKTSAIFNVMSKAQGKHPLDLILSGIDSPIFGLAPGLGELVLLAGDVFTRLRLPRKTLPKGCFKIDIAKCPDGTKKLTFSLSSSSPWYRLKSNPNVLFTFGIVFAESGKLAIPVSLIGLQVDESNNGFKMAFASSNLKADDGHEVPVPDRENCLEIPLSSKDIRELMYSNAFARQYLLSLYEHLPAWIRLTEKDMPLLTVADMKADLMLGKDTQKLLSCQGAPIHDDRYYSVFQFQSGASMSILNKTVNLFSPLKGKKFCLIVDICKDAARTVVLMLPPGSRDILDGLDITNGLKIKVKGIGLSLTRDLAVRLRPKSVRVWTGDEIIPYPVDPSASLWLAGEFIYQRNESSTQIAANADSQFYAVIPSPKTLLTHVFLQEWHSYLKLDAVLNVTVNFKLFEKPRSLHFPSAAVLDSSMYASIGGLAERKMCAPRANPSGIFFAMELEVNPFSFIPVIGEFAVTNRHIAYAFLTYDPRNAILTAKPINIGRDILDLKTRASRIAKSIKDHAKQLVAEATAAGKQFYDKFENHVDMLEANLSKMVEEISFFNLPKLSDALALIRQFVKDVELSFEHFTDALKMPIKTAIEGVINSIKWEVADVKYKVEMLQRRIMQQVTDVVNKKSGWGLKYRTTIEVFSIEFGAMDLEVVYSTNFLGECSRYKRVYELLKGEPALRGLAIFHIRLQIYWWLSVNVGGGFELAMGTESKNFIIRFAGRLKIFEVIRSEVDVYISKAGLTTGAELKAWDLFRVRLIISSTVNVPWKKINVRAEVWFLPGGDNSFEGSLSEAIIDVAKRIGNEANKRLTQAQEIFDIAVAKLSKAQKWLDKKKAEMDKAKKVFDSAVNELKRLERKVEDLKRPFEKAMSKLESAQNKVNRICRIRSCKRICIPGFKCRKKCIKKWRIRICYPRCSKSSCMISIPNVVCLTANAACRVVRKAAYLALGVAKLTVRGIIGTMDVARAGVRVTAFAVDKSRVIVDVAKLPLDLAKVSLEAVKVSFKASKVALEGVKEVVKGAIKVFIFITKNLPIDVKKCGFSAQLSIMDQYVFDVSCELNIFKTGWHTARFRVNFKNPVATIWEAARGMVKGLVNVLKIGKRRKRDLLFRASMQINRVRRSVEDDSGFEDLLTNKTLPFTDTAFDKNTSTGNEKAEDLKATDLRIAYFRNRCKQVTEVDSYLSSVVAFLNGISKEIVTDLENSTTPTTPAPTDEQPTQAVTLESLGINTTEAIEKFNMTREELDAMLQEALESEEIAATQNMSDSLASETGDDPNQSDNYPLLDSWKAEMENVTSDRYSTSVCKGFADCVLVKFGELYDLYSGVDSRLKDRANQAKLIIPEVEEMLLHLLNTNLSMTVTEIYNSTSKILEFLDELRATNPFCVEPPQIKVSPRSKVVLEGAPLVLSCRASDGIVWLKDGIVLNTTADDLRIEKASTDDTGNYQCQTGNIVANITSVVAAVTIENPPTITRQPPVSVSVPEGFEPAVKLDCGLTGIPKPAIKWCISNNEDINRRCIESTGDLVIKKPSFKDSGMYWCEARNIHGNVTSRRSTVVVRKILLGSPAAKMTFGYFLKTSGARWKRSLTNEQILHRAFATSIISNVAVPGVKLELLNNNLTMSYQLLKPIPDMTGNSISYANLSVTFENARTAMRSAIDNLRKAVENEDVTATFPQKTYVADRSTLVMSDVWTYCRAGYEQSNHQVYLCEACPVGQYRADEMPTCRKCPDGTSTKDQASSSLTSCQDPSKICCPNGSNIALYIGLGLGFGLLLMLTIIGTVAFVLRRRHNKTRHLSFTNETQEQPTIMNNPTYEATNFELTESKTTDF
ncbi:uncharacterized protein LOC141906736 [Tubulanus polymorphus]|uniref:uncharacterized protein LOC141906736 n=1 Tax=Tubulanus polymorphus TaxID=672921 RepID=UPI003DA695B2